MASGVVCKGFMGGKLSAWKSGWCVAREGGSFSVEASAVDLDVGQTQCPLSGQALADVQPGRYSEYQVLARSPDWVAPVCFLNLSMPWTRRGHTMHVQLLL